MISGKACAAVECYNFASKEWDDVEPLPRSLTFFATAVTENTLYVGGGKKENDRASRAIFKLENSEWRRISATLPERLLNCVMIPTTPGNVLVLGGTNGDSYN